MNKIGDICGRSFATSLVLALLGWLAFASGMAMAGTLTGELDKAEGTTDDQFVYTLTASGKVSGKPSFPNVAGLDVQSNGVSQNFSLMNGTMTRETRYDFYLTPTRPGTFNIPSIKLTVDGEEMTTLPITLTVHSAAQASGGQAEDRGPLYIERELSKSEVYVGEPVVSTVRVYARLPLLDAEPSQNAPSGFRSIPFKGEKSYSKVIDGTTYRVIEVKEILIPNQAGEVTLDPYSLTARLEAPASSQQRRRPSLFDDFDIFRRRNVIQREASSEPQTITVKPLPSAGRPADFSGLVGHFRLDAELSDGAVKVGETATLTITVRGDAPAAGMSEPNIALGDQVKVYADRPTSKEDLNWQTGLTSEKVFKYALVPTVPGDVSLPDVKVTVFNPDSGQYETLTAELGTLGVSPGEGGAPTQAAAPSTSTLQPPKEVEIKATDILDLHRGSELRETSSGGTSAYVLLGLMPVTGLLVLGMGLVARYRREHADQLKARRTASRAASRFAAAERAGRAIPEPAERVGKLQADFREFLAGRLDVPAKALTPREITSALAGRGIERDLLTRVESALGEADRAVYGGATLSPEQVDGLAQKLTQIVKELEKACR